MSIVDQPQPAPRPALHLNAQADETKVRRPAWDEAAHPRDRVGRFIETGAEVRVWGGALATVVRNVGGGRIEIERADGSHVIVHRNYLTVTKRPDGSAPTSKPDANVQELPEKQPDPNAAEIPKPTTPPNPDMEDIGQTLDHFLRRMDPDLADRVHAASEEYLRAMGNDVPDDEADERANLVAVLDEIDGKYPAERAVAMSSRALREEAEKEPEGSPEVARQVANDEPVTVRAGQPREAGVPIPPPPSDAEPKTEKLAGRLVKDRDVLHTRMGRVTVVGDPVKQPNGSYTLRLDRGDGKPPVEMVVGSRDRVEREIPSPAPAATEAPPEAPPTTPTRGAVGAQPIVPDASVSDAPAADKPDVASPEPRRYRTSPTGAREAEYAAEMQESAGYEAGFTVDGWHVTVTDPNSALYALVGIRNIHADNLNSEDRAVLTREERRQARIGRDALDRLMGDIRRDYGITGDGKPSPRLTDADTPQTPAVEAPAPVKPERRQLDGFSAAESAMIHNAVEDHAAQYYRGPATPTADNAAGFVGGIDAATRYVAEGHLKDLLDTHGMAKVTQAVLGVIRDDESVLTRSQEDRNSRKSERDSKLAEINKRAGAAAQAGNWAEALSGLDEMETVDPTYRPGGLSIDELRTRLTRMQGSEPAPQDDAPDALPEAGPDQDTPEPIHAEDVAVDPPTDSTPVPANELDAPDTTAEVAPEEPQAAPAKPRFATVEAVRQWLRGPGSIPQLARKDPERAERHKATNARIADDPALTLSAGGRLIVHRNPTVGGDKEWRIASPANGLHLGRAGTGRNKEEALQLAALMESHVDAEGNPIPFDADDINSRIRTWRDKDGLGIGNLLLEDRAKVEPGRRRGTDWKDPWWEGQEPEPLAAAPADQDAAPEPAAVEYNHEAMIARWGEDTHRALVGNGDATVGGEWHVAVADDAPMGPDGTFDTTNIYDSNTGERVGTLQVTPNGWVARRDGSGGEASRGGTAREALDALYDAEFGAGAAASAREHEDDWKRDAIAADVAAMAGPNLPEADVDTDEPGDEEVPAVPPVEDAPASAPTVSADGRWKIPAPETTGDPEADKRALAASLRAAARASDNAADRAALNWAARQLVPPAPRPRPEGGAPRKPRTRSPQRQARAQADGDVAAARAARKPPVSPEARMAAIAALADELDRLGVGGVPVTPPTAAESGGGDGEQSGTSIVAALRTFVAEYKKRRAQVDSGAAPVDSGDNQGGTDGSAGDAGTGALREVPAEDVRGSDRPGDVLPEPGDGGGGADRRLGGPDRGAGSPERDVRGEGGPDAAGEAVGGGDRDAGDRVDRPGDSGVGEGPAGDGVPVDDGSVGADRTDATGGPAVGGGDERVPGRDRGAGRDEAPADRAAEEPTRPDDAGLPAEGVTEADQPAPAPEVVPAATGDSTDFRPSGVDDFAPAGKASKLRANIDALVTLRQLQREGRPASPGDQAVLAKWAGWGGLPEVFDETRADYAKQRQELRGLLSESEWNEAKRNTLNAHYTDARVVQAVWDAVGQLGFDGGRVLEPGSGSGTFIGLAPDNANMVGVELDSTTAALSQYLYPTASIRNESFARTNLPDGSFDMTIGNVPFGRFALTDRRHNPDGESIHNHFILKSMDLTRPGGLVAVLTSRYTLDSQDSGARRKMAEKADLVGAVRLPTGSHQRASGTDVIEDLLIFRVREPDAEPGDQSWVTSSKRAIDDQVIAINNYWDEHPENVLGTLEAQPGQYGTGDLIVRGDRDMTDLPAVLSGIVESARENGLTATESGDARPELIDADESRHDGHIRVEEDGSFTQAVNGASVPFEVPASQRAELTSLIGLRDTLRQLLDAESSSRKDTAEIAGLRVRLNNQYDAYVAANGPINRFKLGKTGNRIRPGQGNFRRDPMSAVVRALESYDAATGTATKSSIFTKRAVAPRELRTTTDSPADAISLSMDAYGEVNLPAIATMLGVDEPTARERLGDLVFEQPPVSASLQAIATQDALGMAGMDPSLADTSSFEVDRDRLGEPGPLEPAAAYLSGNVRRKLAMAEAAAELDPRFKANVDALRAIIPPDLGPDEIDGRLGAAWIGPDTVKQFLKELIDDRYNYVQVINHGGSIWTVEGPNYGNLSTEVWGTEKRSASDLVQALLEQRPIKVTRKMDTPDGGSKQVADLEATLAAQAKAEAIQERFGEWLWEDPARARALQKQYNDQFNSLVLRKYDGSNRQFAGMASSWKPRDHQRNAVERIVNEPTALLGHVVGAGKTAEMVMGTAELKRLGMSRKPAIVVPNHMLEQFTREYLEIYPQARLLAAGSEDLRGDGRREFVGRAATGDWDAVILTQGAFESIPMSVEQQEAYIDREMTTMRAQLAQAQAAEVDTRFSTASSAHQKTVKKMEAALLRAEEALKKKLDKQKDVGVSFEQTGIDYLMVDEAHGYSNLRVLSNIQGAGNVGSDRATDLHMKLEYLRETSQSGRVATFATGTPIRNTVTQAYVMQRFLRPDLLEESGITSFDQWAATFGQTVDEVELKPEGTGFRQTTRFAKFRNVPELLKQFHTFADIKLAEDLNLPTPNLDGGKAQIVTVPSTDALADYITDLGQRAEAVRNGLVEPEDDNMLKISGDGRKAALSMQLVGGEHEPGKIEAAADRIASIWEQNKDRVYTDPKTGEDDPIPGALQIVFLDIGTPTGDGWNGYDALKTELTRRGLDAGSVRYIHEAKNDAQKAELFAAARSGRISVLIGSSEKMGVGTNIQKRAVHLHHLDAPWRPSDVEQRDGRIMRQGNWNSDIGISRYVTEGSFDAYMWQTLERKAKFINQIMKGSLDVREIEDIGDTAMSYAEIKALATGNPDVLEKAKTDTALQKLERLARTHNRVQTNLASDIRTSTMNAQTWESFAAQYDAAIPQRVETRGDAFTMTVNGSRYSKRQDAADAFRGRLRAIMDRDRWGDAPPRDIGTVGGFTVTGQVVPVPGGQRQVIIKFDGIPGEVTRIGTDDLELSGFGLVTRLESALEAFEAKRDRLLQSAAEARIEVGRMEGRVGQSFPRAAELEALRIKAQRLNMKIEREARRAAGEDIPFDPLIDSDQYDVPTAAEDVPPEDFGAVTGADLRRAAEDRADAEKTLAIVDGRVVVMLTNRKVAA